MSNFLGRFSPPPKNRRTSFMDVPLSADVLLTVLLSKYLVHSCSIQQSLLFFQDGNRKSEECYHWYWSGNRRCHGNYDGFGSSSKVCDVFFSLQKTHGLWTPNQTFFHWNPELLSLGRQIGHLNSGVFGVFSVKLSAPILVHQWVPWPCFPLFNQKN